MKQITKKLKNQILIEKMLYVLLVLIMIINILVGILVIDTNHKIDQQTLNAQRISITNQKYIRCIVLIPSDVFNNPDIVAKAKALDDCAKQSRLP